MKPPPLGEFRHEKRKLSLAFSPKSHRHIVELRDPGVVSLFHLQTRRPQALKPQAQSPITLQCISTRGCKRCKVSSAPSIQAPRSAKDPERCKASRNPDPETRNLYVSSYLKELSLVRVQRPLASGGLRPSGVVEDLRVPVHGLLSKLAAPYFFSCGKVRQRHKLTVLGSQRQGYRKLRQPPCLQ